MRYRLRTLLIVLSLAPPLLAGAWFRWCNYEEQRQQREFDELIELITTTIRPESTTLREP